MYDQDVGIEIEEQKDPVHDELYVRFQPWAIYPLVCRLPPWHNGGDNPITVRKNRNKSCNRSYKLKRQGNSGKSRWLWFGAFFYSLFIFKSWVKGGENVPKMSKYCPFWYSFCWNSYTHTHTDFFVFWCILTGLYHNGQTKTLPTQHYFFIRL